MKSFISVLFLLVSVAPVAAQPLALGPILFAVTRAIVTAQDQVTQLQQAQMPAIKTQVGFPVGPIISPNIRREIENNIEKTTKQSAETMAKVKEFNSLISKVKANNAILSRLTLPVDTSWIKDYMQGHGIDSVAITVFNKNLLNWGGKLDSLGFSVWQPNGWQPAVNRAAIYLEAFKNGVLCEDTISGYGYGWYKSQLTGETIRDANAGFKQFITVQEGGCFNSNVVPAYLVDHYIGSFEALDSCLIAQGLPVQAKDFRSLYQTQLPSLAIHRWLRQVASFQMHGYSHEDVLKLRSSVFSNDLKDKYLIEDSTISNRIRLGLAGMTFNTSTSSSFCGFYLGLPSIGCYSIQVDVYGKSVTSGVATSIAAHVIESLLKSEQ